MTVAPKGEDERLDVRVAREFALSRRRAQDAIAVGQVDVSGVPVRDPGARVTPDARVVWNANRPRREVARFSLPLAFQDDDLIVVDKPAGLLTVPTDGGSRDDCVLARVRRDLQGLRGARAYAGALHRLDRGTSGLVAIALTPACHAAGRAAFGRHAFTRRYLALVEGVPPKASGTIDLPISDEYEGGRRRVARDDDEPARRAITHYRVVERHQGAALLELQLETGRQHQIRLHLRAIGHPILGDTVYGTKERASGGRPLLHASHLSFAHPLSGRAISCDSPPPDDFQASLARLRRRRP